MKTLTAVVLCPLMALGFIAAVIYIGLWTGWQSAFNDFPKWLATK